MRLQRNSGALDGFPLSLKRLMNYLPWIRWLVLLASILAAQPAAAAAQGERRWPLDTIRNHCIEFTKVKQGSGPDDYRECRVSEFGRLGVVDADTYYYAIYCLIPNWRNINEGHCGDDSVNAVSHRTTALAVFSAAPSQAGLQLAFERASGEIGVYVYLQPSIVQSAAGTLLHLSIAYAGTGNINASEYYVREAGVWERIESESWLKDLQVRLPAGLEIWKGVWPDVRTLRAEASLYRKGDGNCCPTGGVARIQLAFRTRHLVLESVSFERIP